MVLMISLLMFVPLVAIICSDLSGKSKAPAAGGSFWDAPDFDNVGVEEIHRHEYFESLMHDKF